MSLIWFIVVGIVAGWLAGTLMKGGGFGLVGDLVVGVIGAVFGGWLFGQLGISAAVNEMVSRTSRIDGRGGKTNSFWAWYSFRMSFWRVPPSWARDTPAFSAWATNMAKITAAGELIVIDVVISDRSMPA